MFCKHNWSLISETVTKSKIEESIEVLRRANINEELIFPHKLCCAERKHIQVFVCSKCGKLKRFVEQI